MEERNVNIDVNVTKIVKYVCFAGVIIVSIIFTEKGYEYFLKSQNNSGTMSGN